MIYTAEYVSGCWRVVGPGTMIPDIGDGSHAKQISASLNNAFALGALLCTPDGVSPVTSLTKAQAAAEMLMSHGTS